jgi:hypothetical protein
MKDHSATRVDPATFIQYFPSRPLSTGRPGCVPKDLLSSENHDRALTWTIVRDDRAFRISALPKGACPRLGFRCTLTKPVIFDSLPRYYGNRAIISRSRVLYWQKSAYNDREENKLHKKNGPHRPPLSLKYLPELTAGQLLAGCGMVLRGG